MQTIWKFPIYVIDSQPVKMPKGAEILTVQLQGDQIYLWAMVDDGAKPETRIIEVFGTGNPIPVNMGTNRTFIGTFQSPPCVWHVFERTQ